MSFKREGDDPSQLHVLKKRRVADLLARFIPEDEAALLSNGRYTCLVCSHRPVLDTVDMLTVHRKGRRHLEGMKWHYGKKAQLRNEVTKRRHANYVQEEEDEEAEKADGHAERQVTDELSIIRSVLHDRSSETPLISSHPLFMRDVARLTAHLCSQGPSSSAPLLVQTRKITHHALLKTIPYNSCHKKASTPSDKASGSDPDGPPAPSGSAPCEAREGGAGSKPTPAASAPGSYTAVKVNDSKPSISKKEHKARVLTEPVTAQRRRELEHYLQLKSDGWLQDRSGQWVKDENAEFDSDEDEPPPLDALPPGDEKD